MKQYFAKYLPVEGEIKEGDYWLHPIGAVFPYTESYAKGPLASLNCKKVKLFLCSKDIKVGDTLRTFIGTTIPVTGINDNEIPSLQIGIDYKNLFNVIGEISPKAKFVKEGNEFDRSQIKLFYDLLDDLTILIKCPCCDTFI